MVMTRVMGTVAVPSSVHRVMRTRVLTSEGDNRNAKRNQQKLFHTKLSSQPIPKIDQQSKRFACLNLNDALNVPRVEKIAVSFRRVKNQGFCWIW
jgi:hypothetical protein